jgi:hypothetical protein
MRYVLLAVLGSLLNLVSGNIWAWGHTGHETVGAIADQLLTAHAAGKVKQFAGMKLRNAAKWADCVRDVKPNGGKFAYEPDPRFREACKEFEAGDGIARMEDYVRRHWGKCTPGANTQPCPDQFHYADVAIQHTKYSRKFAGTSDHDIVGSISAAIAFLRKQPAPPSFHIKDEKEAILLLAHFVGDIHQPLHIGAVYLDRTGKLINPDGAGKKLDPKTDTHGGNWLEVGTSNMHSEWDSVPPSISPNALSATMLAKARSVRQTSGDLSAWPEIWATESLHATKPAFKGVTFKSDPAKADRWIATMADQKAYDAARSAIQTEQLAKAGARLAQILNAIWP